MASFGVSMTKKNLFIILTILVLFLGSVKPGDMRPLEGNTEKWLNKKSGLVFQSLQQGPVPKPGSNPCSTVGKGNGNYALGHEMNVARKAVRFPPPFPHIAVNFF